MNPSNNKTYTSLEPSYFQSTGVQAPAFNTGQAVSLFSSTSFLYSLAIMLSVLAAGVMYARAGIWRMEASERGVRRSNDEIKRVTLGLLGVLSLFVILYTFNKDLLSGNVGLDGLRAAPGKSGGFVSGGGVPITSNTSSSNSSSKTCEPTNTVIASLKSTGGVCGGARCTALSGCAYQSYLPTIQQESSKAGIDYKMVVVLMCKESSAKPAAQNKNPNGTYDCGLMQINQTTPCDAAILNPETNIARGVSLLKGKLAAVNQIYPNVPTIAGVFASYNCCANGTVPHSPSADCKQETGFDQSVPKWVCPINPGDSQYNMCAVKSYACELTACLNQL